MKITSLTDSGLIIPIEINGNKGVRYLNYKGDTLTLPPDAVVMIDLKRLPVIIEEI